MMEVKSDNLTKYTLMEGQSGEKVIKAESNNAAGGTYLSNTDRSREVSHRRMAVESR